MDSASLVTRILLRLPQHFDTLFSYRLNQFLFAQIRLNAMTYILVQLEPKNLFLLIQELLKQLPCRAFNKYFPKL